MYIVQRSEKISQLKDKGYTAREDHGFYYVFRPDGSRVEKSKSNIDAMDAWEKSITKKRMI